MTRTDSALRLARIVESAQRLGLAKRRDRHWHAEETEVFAEVELPRELRLEVGR